MKVLLALLTVLLAGCGTLFSPVPSNHFKGTIAGVPFEFDTKKQTSAKNIEFTVQSIAGSLTNFSTLKIGEISGINDAQVIDKSYAGQALVIRETFTGINQLAEKVAKGGVEGVTGGPKP